MGVPTLEAAVLACPLPRPPHGSNRRKQLGRQACRTRCHHESRADLRYPAGVKRVLLTGMSGTGKSSLICELAALGYKAIETEAYE